MVGHLVPAGSMFAFWVNGHEWAKRQARKAGLGFTELSKASPRPAAADLPAPNPA